MQQAVSSRHYNNIIEQRGISGYSDCTVCTRDEGCLAQALSTVGNCPSCGMIQFLRGYIDKTGHPAGPTFMSVGDMWQYGWHSAVVDCSETICYKGTFQKEWTKTRSWNLLCMIVSLSLVMEAIQQSPLHLLMQCILHHCCSIPWQ